MTTSTVLDLDQLHLAHGAHKPTDGEACVMEVAAFIKGLPWSDSPPCTSGVIAAFLRSWNDVLPDGERQQLDRYLKCTVCGAIHAAGPANTRDHEPVVPLLDTAGSPELELKRSWMALDWMVRVQAPAWLRCAGLVDQAVVLEGMAEVTPESAPSIKAPLEAVRIDAAAAWAAAGAAAGAAARDAAWAAARDAAWAAARDAAGAAARDAAGAAAWAAAGAAAGAAAWAAAGDAARARLEPTKIELQGRAHELIERLITAEL